MISWQRGSLWSSSRLSLTSSSVLGGAASHGITKQRSCLAIGVQRNTRRYAKRLQSRCVHYLYYDPEVNRCWDLSWLPVRWPGFPVGGGRCAASRTVSPVSPWVQFEALWRQRGVKWGPTARVVGPWERKVFTLKTIVNNICPSIRFNLFISCTYHVLDALTW